MVNIYNSGARGTTQEGVPTLENENVCVDRKGWGV